MEFYAILHDLLKDRKGDVLFKVFGPAHFIFIGLTVLTAVLMIILLRRKSAVTREKAAAAFVNTAFGLYVLDFFLMPFAYEMIDIEKLPFHICTTMCVLCFLSRHTRFFGRFRSQFALFGFISNLVYLIYPAGVMWHQVAPLTYRVIQTLIFHAVMTVYGLLTLLYDETPMTKKTALKDLITITGMTVWAILGNALYAGAAGSYDNHFNWFFVTADPFGMFDPKAAPFIMPFLNIAVFFAVGMLIRLLFHLIHRKRQSR